MSFVMLEPVAEYWLKADSLGVNQMEGAIRLVPIVNEIVKMHALLHFSFCPEETSMPTLKQKFVFMYLNTSPSYIRKDGI